MPLVLSEDGTGLLPFSSPLLGLAIPVGIFGPTLSAFVVTGATEGRAGIRRLLRGYVLWRVGLRWYLFAFIGILAIQQLGAIVLPGGLASFRGLAPLDPLPLLGSFVVTLLFFGPLGEEAGWRGFALPRLQRLHGPLVGSLILGVLWGLWHPPMFWTGLWLAPTIPNIVGFVLLLIPLTVIMTWVFNNTKGSLLIAILLHTANNVYAQVSLFAPPNLDDYALLLGLIGYGAVALLLVALTRGRLGYQHYRRAEEKPDPATAPT